MRKTKTIETIEVCRYKTITECLAAFFYCQKDELSSVRGQFKWSDADGTVHSQEVQEAIRVIKKRPVWGWVEDKRTLHLFIRKRASFRQVLRLVAHELGHTRRPFHRSVKEEQKAEKYAEVATDALDIAQQLTGIKKILIP
jgi:hypothetical protein